ncbi:carboxylesterase family protein [Acetobacter sp. AN02]|uniref:carboxylesterase family protein n=1 Tax=Acetobacter sp. AN02 TaxID=2894186 RepID=UPI00243419CC|nr:carboxylesterase family protein [Acetobacter sp. AN02]MDG6094572.1 carboxylesterase family protein [Acetobacter sp. AN02]
MPTLSVAEGQRRFFLNEMRVRTLAQAYVLEADELVKAAGPVMARFWPPLDGHVLPGDPYSLYEAGLYNDEPALIGTNSDEGALFMPHTGVELYNLGVEKQFGLFGPKLLAAYSADTDCASLHAAREIVGDSIFRWPTWAWARLQSKTGKSPVYSYLFSRKTRNVSIPGPVGALHASEIPFVFGNPQPDWTDADHALSDLMCTYWVNFATTGHLSGKGLPEWDKSDVRGSRLMKLDIRSSRMIDEPCMDRLQLFDQYFAWRRREFMSPKSSAHISHDPDDDECSGV